MEKAIEKINEEMQKEPNNTYLEILGHYIIDRCNEPSVSMAVNGGKSLKGAFDAVQSAAKKKGGSCVVMSDSEIFDVVDSYLGITVSVDARDNAKVSVDGGSVPKKKTVAVIDLDFDSMFGG